MNFEPIVKWISSVNWSNPSWDLLIFVFFIVVSLLYGLSLGRDRIIVILVSIYMALAVVNTAPYIKGLQAEININNFFVFKITTFLGVFLVLFFLLSRSGLMGTIAKSRGLGKWWQVILFSFLHVGLLISVVLSYLAPEAVSKLAPLTKDVFTGDAGRFFWLVAPIVAIVLARDKEEEGE
ncbi:MAG: hypothetical protein PHD51_00955 [Patescibacteria group bacterium]|nr:hypothetical protein [Patescibacteria group bacterium]MDD5490568.1 hypothetical protein [Patescibacteria group bacterium]